MIIINNDIYVFNTIYSKDISENSIYQIKTNFIKNNIYLDTYCNSFVNGPFLDNIEIAIDHNIMKSLEYILHESTKETNLNIQHDFNFNNTLFIKYNELFEISENEIKAQTFIESLKTSIPLLFDNSIEYLDLNNEMLRRTLIYIKIRNSLNPH